MRRLIPFIPFVTFFLALPLLLAAAASVPLDHALRTSAAQLPASELSFWLMLNGDCSGTGAQTLTSTGSSASLTNLVEGKVYSMSCDAAVHWRQGSSVTSSFTATPTTFGERLAATPDKVRWVQRGTSLSIISVSGTANCQVLRCF